MRRCSSSEACCFLDFVNAVDLKQIRFKMSNTYGKPLLSHRNSNHTLGEVPAVIEVVQRICAGGEVGEDDHIVFDVGCLFDLRAFGVADSVERGLHSGRASYPVKVIIFGPDVRQYDRVGRGEYIRHCRFYIERDELGISTRVAYLYRIRRCSAVFGVKSGERRCVALKYFLPYVRRSGAVFIAAAVVYVPFANLM